ncbi:hypothetical protein LCM4577_01590 [Mesorhizobium sp. LCM 4577]|nr:hypothetical protein LCM4577_01590 [Mesorhizobium sp. LCM 4577]OHV71990.1 hypothetical protein LCM4576_19730 [Mesorhizobium sp. LCM 4576]
MPLEFAAFADNLLQIDVGAAACRQASIEAGRGLARRFPDIIELKCAFDQVGYGTILSTRKSMSKAPCFCATD